MTEPNAEPSVSHSTGQDTQEVQEEKALISAENENIKAGAESSRRTTKCLRCENANFLASLMIIVFTPFFIVPLLYILMGLRSDLFITYGTYLAMCIYEAWLFAEGIMAHPGVVAQLEKRRFVGLGLFFIIFFTCLACAFLISFVEGGSTSLFVGQTRQQYVLLEWKCVSFFFLNALHRYIFRNNLVKQGMCPVRAVICMYCVSWLFWAFFAGQIANNVMVSGVNDSWGTWGAFVQSLINGCIFSGHAMWHVLPGDTYIDKVGMAIILGTAFVFVQMLLGYGIIVLFANLVTGLYGTSISQADIMLGVFMFSLVGTLVLTQIAPLYKGLRSRYNPIAFCIFHIILYIIVSLVYYIFFCLTICPLATALLAEDYLPVESIFPIIVFPVIAVIGMARISRLYSAPCCKPRPNAS
ncbi:Hypothetical protein GLP15_3391 [Giardia lamblia P15]|uniref:Uncharacterized protein n=1 Tax=Giardia intestinalis (strain P15) TaxID=658858 RepID=E1EVY7_GIAIA|nr:Hypothetical protein GLP15_3391 [Giardia lamblia P15]